MHHPLKHIIISKDKPALIDFERCHYSKNPKNVSQFIQFISGTRTRLLLKKKGINIDRKKILEASKKYKENLNKKNLDKILNLIS